MGKNKSKIEGMVSVTMNTSNKEKLKDSAISLNKNGDIILRIHAKPNAKTTRVIDIGANEVELAIAAPPHDGQANEALINAMMDILELRKNEITFDTGARSRSKVLRLMSKRITLEEVREKLERNATGKR
ncbi:hypothetical protein LOAG_08565 [Loa loa]|uniref:UPF0235 protein n=1 Tax=Loa loa TaxID=7209 RepID=A0A1I7VHV9_LOALO|nr:hypothetical protein LOAG_08565 [Loa loa]EFO19928.1 hypothetical protein LOAG_08565 [Loa loa]